MNLFVVIFYLLLVDAIIANLLAWSGKQHWWQEHMGKVARHFPLARGWTLLYLAIVCLMGIILHQANTLVLPF